MSNLITELDKVKWDNIADSFVVFDVETTGLDSRKDRIIEIGAVLFEKETYISTGEVKIFQCFVKQKTPIPPEATAINKITDEMVIDGEEEFKTLDLFFDFVGANDLYAYNAKFDKSFINAMAKRSQFSHVPVVDQVFDILKFIREEWIIKPNYKLTSVAKHLKIDANDAHRAVGDSLLALKSYIHVVQMLNMTQRKHDMDRHEWNVKNLPKYNSNIKTDDEIAQADSSRKIQLKKDSPAGLLGVISIIVLVIFLLFILKN
jgi:DNA polymerase III epsilon subunit family exonuclease